MEIDVHRKTEKHLKYRAQNSGDLTEGKAYEDEQCFDFQQDMSLTRIFSPEDECRDILLFS